MKRYRLMACAHGDQWREVGIYGRLVEVWHVTAQSSRHGESWRLENIYPTDTTNTFTVPALPKDVGL